MPKSPTDAKVDFKFFPYKDRYIDTIKYISLSNKVAQEIKNAHLTWRF